MCVFGCECECVLFGWGVTFSGVKPRRLADAMRTPRWGPRKAGCLA